MRNAKYLFLALLVVGFVGQSMAALGSPGSVEVNAEEGFFSDSGDYIMFEWSTDSFDSGCVTVEKEDINARISEGEVTEDAEICMTNKETRAEFQFRDGGRMDVKAIDYLFNTESWGSYYLRPDKSERIDAYRDWADANCESVDSDNSNTYFYNERTDWKTNMYGDMTCASEGNNILYHLSEIESTATIQMTNTFVLNGRETSNTVEGDAESGDSITVGSNNPSAVIEQNGVPIAKFMFQGGYQQPWSFPEPDDELIIHNTDTQRSYIGAKRWYSGGNGWLSYASSAESDLAQDLLNGDYSENRLEELAVTEADNLFGSEYSNSEFYDSDVSFSLNSDSPSGDRGSLVVTGNNRETTASSIQVGVKAEEIGYFIPEATPTIENIDAPSEIDEGARGTVNVEVGNREDASARGDFGVTMSCNSPFSTDDTSYPASPEPGDSVEVPILVTGYSDSTSSASIDGSCEVTVENLNNREETITETVDLTLSQQQTCENPNDEFFNTTASGNDKIWKCGDSGIEISFLKECGSNETATEVSDGDYECQQKSEPQQEECGNDIDDDGDGLVDEGCEDDDPGEKVLWIPTQDESACISQVVEDDVQLDPSYDSKSDCQNAIDGAIGCDVVVPDVIPYTDAEEFEFICGDNKIYANVLLTLLIGLIGAGTGRRIGRGIDVDGDTDLALILAVGLGVLGAVIGFAVISVAQALGLLIGFIVLYIIFKAVMFYTGAGKVVNLLSSE